MAIHDARDIHPDFGSLPVSKGVPTPVFILAALGILAVFIIGGAVILNAGYGHYWPANHTLRAPLGNMPS